MDVKTQHGADYSAAHLGSLLSLMRYEYTFAALDNRKVPGKVFLKEPLQLTGAEISYNCFPPGAAMPFSHQHREHEEIYLFLSGQGEFMVNEALFAIAEGSVVRVSTGGIRAYRNTGAEDLRFIVLQVKQDSLQQGTIDDGIRLPGKVGWPVVGQTA
jgi:mannose-6-phosphate isomerase-like protein (cupin superfamily)